MLRLSEIQRSAPNVPGYGGGKWAMYGALCCWWTADPKDMGQHEGGLPCCPHCGGPLFQARLEPFLKSAREHPEHYGSGGILTFAAAHSRNATTCHRSWDKYRMEDA